MTPDNHKLGMASGRLEALGDGIFSVAMTILVFELTVPSMQGSSWNEFRQSLSHSWTGILCYMISFIILGIMWFGHRIMFEYIGKTNRYFIFLGVVFYMIVCLVPFSTRFLSRNSLQWYAIMVYAINLSLCNITLYAQWRYGSSRESLLHREVPDEVKREANFLFMLSPLVYIIAVGISFIYPKVSLAIFVVTPLIYLLPGKLDKYLP